MKPAPPVIRARKLEDPYSKHCRRHGTRRDGTPAGCRWRTVAEGGTGSTDAATARADLGVVDVKAGIVDVSSFSGTPATATVTFATPYPAGTSYGCC